MVLAIGATTLQSLFEGALVERGATIEDSLGDACNRGGGGSLTSGRQFISPTPTYVAFVMPPTVNGPFIFPPA